MTSRPGLAFLLLGAFGACGGGGGGGGVPLGELPQQAAAATCASFVACGLFSDQATCLAVNGPTNFVQLTASVAAGKVKYDGHAAAVCLAATASRPCSRTDSTYPPPASCGQIFTGTLADHDACIVDGECASGLCDRSTCGNERCCRGVCMGAGARAPLGATCGLVPCQDGTYCDGNAVCSPLRPAGSPCGDAVGSCALGSACVAAVAGDTSTAVCGRYPSEGEACRQDLPCDSTRDRCDFSLGQCRPFLRLGDDCPSFAGCPSYATCDTATLTCVLGTGNPGDSCPVNGDSCLGNLVCTNNVCTLPQLPAACP